MTDTLHLPSINISEANDNSSTIENSNIDSYNSKRTSNSSSLHPTHPHTWWDESQLDLDLAEDPILIAPTNKKQKLKEKFMGTMRHHSQHPQQQRTSWMSSSSTNSSLYSTHSLSTSPRSKLSRSFLQLRQWITKKH
ncbi:unnamed protein product [Cunninghamella blakesleeana]